MKALDYYEYGQSWFQQKSMRSNPMLKFLGIDLDKKVAQEHRLYVAWLELDDTLPPQALKIVDEYTRFVKTLFSTSAICLSLHQVRGYGCLSDPAQPQGQVQEERLEAQH